MVHSTFSYYTVQYSYPHHRIIERAQSTMQYNNRSSDSTASGEAVDQEKTCPLSANHHRSSLIRHYLLTGYSLAQ